MAKYKLRTLTFQAHGPATRLNCSRRYCAGTRARVRMGKPRMSGPSRKLQAASRKREKKI